MILSKILSEESHKTPARCLPRTTACHGKTLAGPPGKALTKGVSGATARPAPTKFLPTISMQLPAQLAEHAPAWEHAAPRPTQHAPAWRHADLCEVPTTAPPQLPACLHGAACIAGQGACRSEEGRRRTGRASFPSPIKQGDT